MKNIMIKEIKIINETAYEKEFSNCFRVISLIADIITMTSALKWVLINWLGVEEKNATSINTIIIVIATACLLLTLLYACWYTYEKFKKQEHVK